MATLTKRPDNSGPFLEWKRYDEPIPSQLLSSEQLESQKLANWMEGKGAYFAVNQETSDMFLAVPIWQSKSPEIAQIKEVVQLRTSAMGTLSPKEAVLEWTDSLQASIKNCKKGNLEGFIPYEIGDVIFDYEKEEEPWKGTFRIVSIPDEKSSYWQDIGKRMPGVLKKYIPLGVKYIDFQRSYSHMKSYLENNPEASLADYDSVHPDTSNLRRLGWIVPTRVIAEIVKEETVQIGKKGLGLVADGCFIYLAGKVSMLMLDKTVLFCTLAPPLVGGTLMAGACGIYVVTAWNRGMRMGELALRTAIFTGEVIGKLYTAVRSII